MMGFSEMFEDWAKSWKQRNVSAIIQRYERIFGKWPDWKLKKLFAEADMEFDRFPTPNKLKQLAIELGLYESNIPSEPKGCPLCNYTGFVPVETLTGHEVAATCMCEKGKWLQRMSETIPYEGEKVYPRVSVQKLMKKEGYKPQWAATCGGCVHWDCDRGICKLTGEVRDEEHMACVEYREKPMRMEPVKVELKTIPGPQEVEDDEFPF